MSRANKRVVVIGGGIAGLVTAWRLAQRGATCHVFEAGPQLGGAVCTVSRDGYLMELGPNTMPDKGGILSKIIDELGLSPVRISPNNRSKKRYIVRDGKMVALPMGPGDLVKSPFLSSGAKLRLLGEPFVGRFEEPGVDESLASFTKRRFGQEVLDYAVNPFVSGTYAGNPRHLSARHSFELLTRLEDEAGSVILGGIKTALGRARGGDSADKSPVGKGMVNFEQGVITLINALAAQVGTEPLCGARATGVRRDEGGTWTVTVEVDGQPQEHVADAVVVATSGIAAASIAVDPGHGPLDMEPFAAIEHPALAVVALGFKANRIEHPLDGFGVLIPEVERFNTLGALFSSTIFPGRAPEGHVLLMSFIGGAREPEAAMRSEDEHLQMVMDDLRRLVGVRGEPELVVRRHWRHSIPQYEVGYGRIKEGIDAIEARCPGVYWTGNYRDGISVADVVRHAELTAERAAIHLDLL